MGKAAIEAVNAEAAEGKTGDQKRDSEDRYFDRQKLKEYKKALSAEVDRYGNPKYSDETVRRAVIAKRQGEEFDLDEYEDGVRRARAEAEAVRQREIESILGGRELVTAVREMTIDMERLEKEIAELKGDVYFDPEMKKYQKRQLEQARAQYTSMSVRREKLLGEMTEAEQEMALYEEDETSPVSGEFDGVNEADANTERKVVRAQCEALLEKLGEQDAELKAALEKKMAELDATDDEMFEQVDRGVQDTAEAMEADVREEAHKEEVREEEARKEEYWQNVAALAEEARMHPGRWMSDEEKAAEKAEEERSREKREGLVRKLYEKLKKRKVLKRAVATAIVTLGVAVFLSGSALVRNGSERSYAQEKGIDDNNGGEAGTGSGGQMGDVAGELGITAEDLANAGEIDLSKKTEVGEAVYANFMERENSEMAENGLMANFTEWHEANDGKGTNNFGKNLNYIMDLNEERDQAFAEAKLEVIRDQPQALASFVANHPQIMAACGIGTEITQNENIEQRAQAVFALLQGEGGGALQKDLVGASAIALFNDNTSFEFYQENGLERTAYSTSADPNAPLSVNNMYLGFDTLQRNGDPQVQIVFVYEDGTQSTSDCHLGCGTQENLTVESGVRQVIIILPAGQVGVTPPKEEVPPAEGSGTPENGEQENPDEGEPEGEVPPAEGEPEPQEPDKDQEDPDEKEPEGGEPEDGEQENPDEPEPGEAVKPKDEENEQKVVEDGGQKNEVNQTEDVDKKPGGEIVESSNEDVAGEIPQENITGNTTGTYDKTPESSAVTGEKVENQVVDTTTAPEQQVTDQEAQGNADQQYQDVDLSNMTDEELNEYVDSLL